MRNNFTRSAPVKLFLLGLLTLFAASVMAQAPTISSFSPAAGTVGTPVTITGANFNTTNTNNIVFFGATRANVTAASTTSLTVTVPSGATYGAITVLNSGTSLAAYSGKFFLPVFSPNKGTITSADFAAKVDFPTGTAPYSVVIADIDGDGKPDLVIPNIGFSTVSVLLNNGSPGNPGFAAKMDFPIGSTPVSLAVGDLDGDGKPDLVTTNLANNTVSVLLNTSSVGSISFAAEADFATGSLPYSVAIGDIDGDGKPDLVVANSNDNTVSVLLNNGSPGNISFAAQTTFATGVTPQSVAIGDIDGDGKPDLAVANIDANSVSVLLNNSSPGSLSFAGNVDLPTGSEPISVALGDIDGDGKLDLAVANLNSATVSVLLNTGGVGVVSFAGKVDKAVGTHPYSVAIGDINGDGKPDLAVANADSNTLSVFSNTSSTGSLSFGTKADLATASLPFSVAIGDIDGDGKPDLVVANDFSSKVSVLRNNPSSMPVVTSFTPASGPVGTLVTINGSNLNAPTAFTIGGQTAIVVSNDGSTLVGLVMPGTATGGVSVTTGNGSASGASNFTVTTLGAITAQQGNKLTGPAFGLLGAAVALSADGNTAILGGGGFYFNCRCGFLTQGGAYIYIRSGGVWTQQGPMLMGTGGSSTANQGISVAISADGNTAVMGGSGDDSNAGAIWVFTRTAGTWSQQGAKLVGSGATNGPGGAQQGASVAISADGNTIMEGGPGNNNTGGTWVFTRSNGVWTQQGNVMIGTDIGSDNAQGSAVALSADGNTAAVGDIDDNGSIGTARIWTRTGSTWTQQGSKLTGPSVRFPKEGTAVALSADGNTVLVGGAFDNNSVGGIWVFTRSGGVWTEQGTEMTGTGFSGTPNQGWAVSLSADGNTALVGGPVDNSNEGATWVFTRSGGVWTQQGSKLVGAGASASGGQGRGAAISADGSTAMTGGPHDSSNTGSAWVFTPFSTVAPATQASNVVFTNTAATTTTASWINGDGASRAVFMAAASSGIPAPVNQVNYNANAAFGSGDQIGSTGWYCVYNGTGSTVDITGLTAGTTYQVMAVEYNGTGSNIAYLTTAGTGNPAGVTTTVALVAINSLSMTGSSPTNAASVNYTATFGAAITGLTASNFSISASGPTGTSVGTPTTADGGITWTIPVNTGTGDGAIQLQLANATGISPGISTGLPFLGDTYTIDKTAPTALTLTYSSNHSGNPQLAETGDVVSLVFIASEQVQIPVLSIAGHTVTASNVGGNEWLGSYTMTSADTQGRIPFTLSFTDIAGNPQAGAPYNDVAAGDDIEFVANIATLASLTTSNSRLGPGFISTKTSYKMTVGDIDFFTLTPTATDPAALITVNGTTVASGAVSQNIPLVIGSNPVSIVVTSADHGTVDIYTINVTRKPSTNANLSNLRISNTHLSPAFNKDSTNYTASVRLSTISVIATPVAAHATTLILVNGQPVASGTGSDPITLGTGIDTITTVVTAQDSITTKTYTVLINHRSANANLRNIKLSKGTLSPVFSQADTSYTAEVDNSISSITVKPFTRDSTATVAVNGIAVAPGAASQPLALNVGPDTIKVTGLAVNGVNTKTYTIVVTRDGPGPANSLYQPISVISPANNPEISDNITVHQGVSPNGDGINDVLVIDGITAYPDNKLSVMSRNGELVFEAAGYDNSTKAFDGHSNKNGKMQSPGTYFYALDYKVAGVTKHKTGFIVLKY